jgi:hypothetical protein
MLQVLVSRQAHREWCKLYLTHDFNTLLPLLGGYCVILWYLAQFCWFSNFTAFLHVNDKQISQFLFKIRTRKEFG